MKDFMTATNRRDFIVKLIGSGFAAALPASSPAADASAKRKPNELGPVVLNWEVRRAKGLSGKKAAMYIDDVIWVFRDLARRRPKSLFGNPFLAMLKEAHERYGLKVQLNCFFRTDVFYGMDEFSLDDMTDAYKAQWQAAKDWLKLGFHAYQEFPDYPFVNSSYGDVAAVYDRIFNAVCRFAGEGVFTSALVGHWLPFSKEGCRALKDRGVELVACTDGVRYAYDGDRSSLPYGHAYRVENRRRPETALFQRSAYDPALLSSVSGYNHLSPDQAAKTWGSFDCVYDLDLKIGFKRFRNGPMLNLCDEARVRSDMASERERELLVIGDHEQYFYQDYFAYQPDYAAKVLLAARLAKEDGREFIFIEDTAP
jgi:hypothetical protein